MKDDMTLKQIRMQIDEIDARIIKLLHERFKKTAEIGAIKRDIDKPVIDKDREEILHEHLARLCRETDMQESFVQAVWKLILQESYRIQNEKK